MDTTTMEALEMDHRYDSAGVDFFATMLKTYSSNNNHIRTTISSISQTLMDNNIPISPISYLDSIISSLRDHDRLSESSIDALLFLLSVILPRVSAGIVSRNEGVLLEFVFRVLRGGRLSEDSVDAGFKCVDGSIQKKAYKVLSMLLKVAFNLFELSNILHSTPYHLLIADQGFELRRRKDSALLFLQSNRKTRNKAYDVLLQIGHAFEDDDRSGNKEGRLLQFFHTIVGFLDWETPQMTSAAVKGLARLTYEFTDLLSAAYQLLPDSFLLLQSEYREIIKANLGLLKVVIAKSQSENLDNYLKVMVESLLKLPCETKNHFKSKVKHLLAMLMKKCGLEAVKAVMPEEHMKLLTNIRKIKERREKLASNSETGSYLSKATTSRRSDWVHTKIFSDFGEDSSDLETSIGRRSLMSSQKSQACSSRQYSGKTLSEDVLDQLKDDPLDLLDQEKTRLALRLNGRLKRKHNSDDELEFDEDGKLIIPEEGKQKTERPSYGQDSDDNRSEVASFASRNPKKAGKRKKTSESGWGYTENEYTTKKARGDVKKKGKLEPYAYWPLDRKMLSRRPQHRACARRGMASVVKMTKNLQGKTVANALALKKKKPKNIYNKR